MSVVEMWAAFPGFSSYQVSTLGRIRSLDRVITRRDGVTVPRKGRVLSLQTSKFGYRTVRATNDAGEQLTVTLHSAVAETFIGPRPDGYHVCHNDGNPANNHLENLRYDTPSGNNRDKRRHGTDHSVNKVHCPRGHLLAEPNLCLDRVPLDHRVCLACNRASAILRVDDERFQELSDVYYRDLLANPGSRANRLKTHCKHGHEFTPENTIKTKSGRNCRECKNEGARRARRKSNGTGK